MTSQHEIDGTTPANILLLDGLLDSQPEPDLGEDVRLGALNYVLPRVQELCKDVDPQSDESVRLRAVSVSEPLPYTSAEGNTANIRLCILKGFADPARQGVGVILEIDQFSTVPPILSLYPHRLAFDPTALSGRGARKEHPDDLRALFSIIGLFDGKPALGADTDEVAP